MSRLTPEQWQAIQVEWEFDPDEPSFEEAASRAASKYEFAPPRRQSIHERAKRYQWERRGSLNGINIAAHRRADAEIRVVPVPQPEGLALPDAQPDANSFGKADQTEDSRGSAELAMSARETDIDKRTATRLRHRKEWVNIAVLRNEAISLRNTDPVRCSERLRQVKLAAEITAIQQSGERKAWGLDLGLDPIDMSSLSDEAVEAIAAGRMPKRH
jgi:hypothetical protein